MDINAFISLKAVVSVAAAFSFPAMAFDKNAAKVHRRASSRPGDLAVKKNDAWETKAGFQRAERTLRNHVRFQVIQILTKGFP